MASAEVGQILTEAQTLRIYQVVDRARMTFPKSVRPLRDDFKYALVANPAGCLLRVAVCDPGCEVPVFTEIVVDRLGRVVGEEFLVRCERAAGTDSPVGAVA